MPIVYLLIAAVLFTGGAVQYAFIGGGSSAIADTEQPFEPKQETGAAFVTLEEGMDREAIAEKIGTALGLDEETIHQLHDTYRSMQWDAFNEALVPFLVEKYELTEEDREILLTHSTVYLDRDTDILESLYKAEGYAFETGDSVVEIATALLGPLSSNKEEEAPPLIDENAEKELLRYVRAETELLPDLVPLPPLDVDLRQENGRTLLVFTTIYYNQGKGNLELRADPDTIGVLGDVDRDVYQRIYRDNGTYRDRISGTFHWHQEHLHYHFQDFIEYTLTAAPGTSEVVDGGLGQKSTFCIRDVSRVYIEGVADDVSADYRICGRNLQGVSVGWGDAYFNTYVDQNLDISDLPSGEYDLTFIANPADRFDESDVSNNVSSARVRYSKEEGTAEVIGTTPQELPHFEHIHIEQDL